MGETDPFGFDLDTAWHSISAFVLTFFADEFVKGQDFFWLVLRDKSKGGRKERCDEGKVIYCVFKLCLMKMKYYNL